jgi:hypothetical protein
VDTKKLARDLHELWERAQTIQLDARELVARDSRLHGWRRLALELALQDLLSFAGRAAALAELAEAAPRTRGKR